MPAHTGFAFVIDGEKLLLPCAVPETLNLRNQSIGYRVAMARADDGQNHADDIRSREDRRCRHTSRRIGHAVLIIRALEVHIVGMVQIMPAEPAIDVDLTAGLWRVRRSEDRLELVLQHEAVAIAEHDVVLNARRDHAVAGADRSSPRAQDDVVRHQGWRSTHDGISIIVVGEQVSQNRILARALADDQALGMIAIGMAGAIEAIGNDVLDPQRGMQIGTGILEMPVGDRLVRAKGDEAAADFDIRHRLGRVLGLKPQRIEILQLRPVAIMSVIQAPDIQVPEMHVLGILDLERVIRDEDAGPGRAFARNDDVIRRDRQVGLQLNAAGNLEYDDVQNV